MVNHRQMKFLKKIVKTKGTYNEASIYYKFFFVSILIASIAALPGINIAIITYIKAVLLFLIATFFFLSFFYFLINETSRIQSIGALNSVILKLQYGDWKWVMTALINRPIKLHSNVLNHPISLFIIGKYLLLEGHSEIGQSYISTAIKIIPQLKKVELNKTLNNTDAEYFTELLKKEKKFKYFFIFSIFWKRKSIRFLVIGVIVLFLCLHYFVLLFSWFV